MAVVIRLQRHGRSKRPFYRIVAIDSRNRRDGRELERLGWYNPLITEDNINIKEDRINYWMENGANTSNAVHGLFKKIGFNFKRDLERQGKSKEEIEKLVADYIKSQEEIRNKKVEAKKKAKETITKASAEEAAEEASAEEAVSEAAEEAPAEEAAEEASAEEAVVEAAEEASAEEAVSEAAEEASAEEAVSEAEEEASTEEVDVKGNAEENKATDK